MIVFLTTLMCHFWVHLGCDHKICYTKRLINWLIDRPINQLISRFSQKLTSANSVCSYAWDLQITYQPATSYRHTTSHWVLNITQSTSYKSNRLSVTIVINKLTVCCLIFRVNVCIDVIYCVFAFGRLTVSVALNRSWLLVNWICLATL